MVNFKEAVSITPESMFLVIKALASPLFLAGVVRQCNSEANRACSRDRFSL